MFYFNIVSVSHSNLLLAVLPHKIAAVRPPASNLTNYPSKMNNTWGHC